MKYPEEARIGDKTYKINTDFRVAIKCFEVSEDASINGYERFLAIIYLLFGNDGLKDSDNYQKLMELAQKYLSCGKEPHDSQGEPDMDYVQDEGLIRSSFQYDYKYDPYEEPHVHWWKYFNDLNNLSNSEMGNCCALNRARAFRRLDLSKIKDPKERAEAQEAKDYYSLKKTKKQREFTEEEIRNMEEFDRLMGGG